MRLTGIFIIYLVLMAAPIYVIGQNSPLSDFLHFENFRRGNNSADVSIMAISPMGPESLHSSIQSSVGGMVSYRVWDWSYSLRFQRGINSHQSYNFPYYVDDALIDYENRDIGLISYLSLGVDRKVFQIGQDLFIDAGISVFGINKPNGISQAEKIALEGEELQFDKSDLEFDFGMGLNIKTTVYIHRYIGLLGGLNFDNSFRDLESSWFSYYLGFKFYIK